MKTKPWVDSNRQDFETYKGEDYWSYLDFPNLEILEVSGDENICPSHQSNFFKWEALAYESCIYSDMDILYVKPLDTIYELLNSCAMTINHNGRYFSHGFMSSKGDNSFFKDLYEFLLENFKSSTYQGAGSNVLYGYLNCPQPKALEALRVQHPQLTVWNFPKTLVYPWPYNSIHSYFLELHETLPEECIGLHWYAGSSLSQRFNMKINPETVHTLENTVCYHAKKCLDLYEGV